MTYRNIVVAGGSIAGLTAAQTLRLEGYDGAITMVSDEPVPPYTRVPLSKGVLAGREHIDDVVLWGDDLEVQLILSTPVTGLDLTDKMLGTSGGSVAFDALVIATGARARRIGTADQDELVLRSHADAVRLCTAAGTASRAVVVGGGVLGMEIGSTLADLGLDVTVIDMLPAMERLLGPYVAAYVRRVADRAGVRLVLSPGGVELVGSPTVDAVRTSDGELLTADLVLSAVGDVPNVEWLRDSGLTLDSGIVVDARCRAATNVVAAGDVAQTTAWGRTPTWTSAVEQGRAAALTLLHGEDAPPLMPSRYMWTEQFGLDVKMAGRMSPGGDPEVLDGELDDGSALLRWSDGDQPMTVIAVNHTMPVGRLKRMAAAPTSE
jgi:3-phenylpropionate/trans-cinnamate dioxygenase ferredoxin reductase component